VRAAAFILVLLLVAVSTSGRANAQATLEKCTCQLDSKDAAGTNGSRAANATLCVQQKDDNRHWCEVTIECLRGGLGPDCSGMQNDTGRFTKLFFQHIEQLSHDPSVVAKEMISQQKDTGASLENTLKNDSATFLSCFTYYLDKKPIYLDGKYGLQCDVSKDGSAVVQIEAKPYSILYYFAAQTK
jgi:hypothetical protein